MLSVGAGSAAWCIQYCDGGAERLGGAQRSEVREAFARQDCASRQLVLCTMVTDGDATKRRPDTASRYETRERGASRASV
eukprot:4808297-Prymnesium_polylepis.1